MEITNTVIARHLNGDEFVLSGCKTVNDVRVQVANRHKRFAPEVSVLSDKCEPLMLAINEEHAEGEAVDAWCSLMGSPNSPFMSLHEEIEYRNEHIDPSLPSSLPRDRDGMLRGINSVASSSLQPPPALLVTVILSALTYDKPLWCRAIRAHAAAGDQAGVQRAVEHINNGPSFFEEEGAGEERSSSPFFAPAVRGHEIAAEILLNHLKENFEVLTYSTERHNNRNSSSPSSSIAEGPTKLDDDPLIPPSSAHARETAVDSFEKRERALLMILLHAAGPCVDRPDAREHTSLYWAVFTKRAFMVDALLRAGASPNIVNAFGETCLLSASRKGYAEIVNLLCNTNSSSNNSKNNGSTKNSNSDSSNDGISHSVFTPVVCHENLAAPIRACNVDHADKMGLTSLMWAAMYGHDSVVRRLIDAGAAINHANARGQTSLSWACANGHEAVVVALCEARADVHGRDIEGMTPVDCARRRSRHGVVDILLRYT